LVQRVRWRKIPKERKEKIGRKIIRQPIKDIKDKKKRNKHVKRERRTQSERRR